ncbi:MAG: ECF-type sigma factor [Zavarzinella sp.]
MTPVTQLLRAAEQGDRQAAAELLPVVYTELRVLAAARMAQEHHAQSLDATALVHEAYLRLVGDQQFAGRGHFFAAAAEAMRRILIDRARERASLKRGGNHLVQSLDQLDVPAGNQDDDELLHLDEAMQLFAATYPDHAQLVSLRFYGGLTLDEIAQLQQISPSTADRRWRFARAWLKYQMQRDKKAE